MSPGNWCTTTEAVEQLGVTRPTVLGWLKAGTLEGRRVSRGERSVWQVDRNSVKRCLEDRGGRGARRGRPVGSFSALTREVQALRDRLDSVEAILTDRRGRTSVPDSDMDLDSVLTSTVLARLLALLTLAGNEGVAQMGRTVRTFEQLAEELAGKGGTSAGEQLQK